MVNVGSADRAVRFVLGFALLIAPFLSPFAEWGAWKVALAVVGLVLVGTAVFRVCPAYLLFGIRTCQIGRR